MCHQYQEDPIGMYARETSLYTAVLMPLLNFKLSVYFASLCKFAVCYHLDVCVAPLPPGCHVVDLSCQGANFINN